MANIPGIPHNISKSFTATGQSDGLFVGKDERFTISTVDVSSFNGTLNMVRRLPGQTTWQFVEALTVPVEKDGIAAQTQEIAIECSAFTSGEALGYLGK